MKVKNFLILLAVSLLSLGGGVAMILSNSGKLSTLGLFGYFITLLAIMATLILSVAFIVCKVERNLY